MRRFNQGDTVVAITMFAGAPHLAAELFTRRAGIALVYPPYEGSAQTLTSLTVRQAQGMFNGMLASYPTVKSNQLRQLAVLIETRWPRLHD